MSLACISKLESLPAFHCSKQNQITPRMLVVRESERSAWLHAQQGLGRIYEARAFCLLLTRRAEAAQLPARSPWRINTPNLLILDVVDSAAPWECESVEVNKCLVCTRREGGRGRMPRRCARAEGHLRFNKWRFVWAEICSERRLRASRQLQTKRSVNVLRRPTAPTFYQGCEF